MGKNAEQKIIDSWKRNVQPWVVAIRSGEIESRVLITNDAIIKTVISCRPKTVLDLGCGEGWLIRELNKAGILSLGIDVVPELIDYAQQEKAGHFKVMSFKNISPHTIKEKFDAIICNFSLLGKQSVNHLFQQAPALLNPSGSLIIQTVHPVTAGEENYKDGWRKGSWTGFNNTFTDPAPWYFRTLESWKTLFLENGFKLSRIIEPLDHKTKKPASIIFIGIPANKHINEV